MIFIIYNKKKEFKVEITSPVPKKNELIQSFSRRWNGMRIPEKAINVFCKVNKLKYSEVES
jgi:hypothetical protein